MSGGGQRLVLVPGMIVPFWASPDLSHRAGSAESEAAWDAPAVWLSREPRQAWQRLAHLWVFLYEKGYQTSSGLISSVSVKLKGLAVTQLPGLGPQVWDVADYVFPAQGDNSFVVMTNFIVTPKQTQGYCAEHPEGGICKEDSGCTPGKAKRKAQGIRTGKCVAFNDTVKTCEIFGWCPVEVDDDIPRISFPRFKVNRRNLVEEVNAAHMKTCLFHKTLHPLCPVFQLGYVVQESGQNFSTLAEKGGVVGITIDWHCDLDWHVRHCRPIYEFHGLYEEKNLSPGFNFRTPDPRQSPPSPSCHLIPSPRFARHFVENGTNYRHLFKVFGIRFDILVDGKAGKFDIIPTMTTIGSGIGIFGVATVLCDLLLLHILPKRHYYKQKKFKYAEDMGPGAAERDLAATSSTLGLQENMRTS
ncbi:P2X purinoceptor 1 isoform X3 [Homo sapiens]|uniref:P2X purinoceptor 1 isoform X3 n=1 Tax=Homo sapiens TaxID=9606 RepID=UPI0005D02A8D|nr:P2X purinoceptor 1 isoform X3 [Homo sapiens]XP_054172266.1 P2X purinoceptor 1 isoform X3 [Homo sapiens]|eukprot:XP_011522200.1 P2X purinoceptor 1 isoform X3 [Homo sapiens]